MSTWTFARQRKSESYTSTQKHPTPVTKIPNTKNNVKNQKKKHIICVVPRNFFLLKSFSKYFGSASGGFLHAGTRFVKFNLLNSFPFNSNGGILNMISVTLDCHTFTSLGRKFETRKVRDGETLYSTGVLTTLWHSFFG